MTHPTRGPIAALFCAMMLLAAPSFAQTAETRPDSLTETYGDWTVTCGLDEATSTNICRMAQILSQGEQQILSVFIRADDTAPDTAIATMITPLGVDLAKGVAVVVDEIPLIEVGYVTCRQGGCIVRASLDGTILQTMQAGVAAKVAIGALDGSTLDVPVSLNGFTAAWQRLQTL